MSCPSNFNPDFEPEPLSPDENDFVTIPREEYELLCEGFLASYEEDEL